MVLKFLSLLFSYFAIMFNIYAFVKVYGMISDKKFKLNFINSIILICLTIIIFLSNYYLKMPWKFIIAFIIIFIAYLYYYKENFTLLLFKLFIIYLILSISDFLISMVFLIFPYTSFNELGSITVIKALCTILDSLLLLLLFNLNFISTLINKLTGYVMKKWSILFLVISFFTFMISILLIYLYAAKIDFEIFLISILLISFFLFLCIIMIFQYFNNKNKEEEQKTLLNLMSEYERVLDNDRINRHEMLNNLVTLKTYKNKSSLEYEQILDDIINSYELKKSEFYSKLYKLPSGIKGIIYYKIANIKDKNINVQLLISNEVKNEFEKLNSRLYYRVCKILGIVMDNSIEAASESDEKSILVDIYLEDGNIIFYIENSFNNNIDLNKIVDKGESSKGKNRGYGLFIASKLVKEKDDIVFEQNVDSNRFKSILTIKNL